MKLLFVHKIVGVAGSENYLLQLLPALKKRGVTVEFLSIFPFRNKNASIKYNQLLAQKDIKTHALSYPGYPSISFILKAKKLIKDGGYDMVHSHLIHADLFIAILKYFFMRKLTLVSTKHGYEEDYYKNALDPAFKVKNKYWYLAKFAEKQITRSFAVSKGLQKLYAGLDICQGDEIDMIHHGFDYEETTANATYRKSPHQLAVIGRLTELKGHRFALKAVSLLKKKFPDIKLLIAGTGDMESGLKRMAMELDIMEQVEFLGYNPDGKAIMADSDVVLVPSVAEGFGLVILEAFSVHTPVVSFNVPAVNEIVEDKISGRLIAPFNVDDFVSAIEDLLLNKSLQEKYSENAYSKLNSYFSENRMVSETMHFYEEVMKQNSTGKPSD